MYEIFFVNFWVRPL